MAKNRRAATADQSYLQAAWARQAAGSRDTDGRLRVAPKGQEIIWVWQFPPRCLQSGGPLAGWAFGGDNRAAEEQRPYPKRQAMTDQEAFLDLNEFQARPRARRWWPKTLAICAVLGGVYGAAIGSAISTTPGAASLIGTAAAVMALLCGVPGARYGFFFGLVNRIRFGRLFVGTVATIAGAILGGYFGIVAATPLGAILGAVGGWFFGRSISQRDYRFRNGLLGILLGVCIWRLRSGIAAGRGCGPARDAMGPRDWGDYRPAPLAVVQWNTVFVAPHARQRQRELRRCDFPKIRSSKV